VRRKALTSFSSSRLNARFFDRTLWVCGMARISVTSAFASRTSFRPWLVWCVFEQGMGGFGRGLGSDGSDLILIRLVILSTIVIDIVISSKLAPATKR
jgi:hypothetical protein